MLRLIFVFTIIVIGGFFAVQGPFYALLFYLWYAYFRPELWVWDGDLVSQLNLSFAIGAFLLLASLTAIRNFRWNRQLALMALFFAQSVVSLVMSEHQDWSFVFWFEFVKVLTIATLITFLVSDRQRFRATLLVIALSLGLEAAKQGWAQLILNPGAPNNNPHPVLGDNNGVAVGVMMLIPLFVALAQTASARWERYLHRSFVIGLFYRGVTTYSRGGFLTASAIGLMALWRSPRKLRAVVGMAVLAIVVGTVMPPQFWQRMQTINAGTDQQDPAQRGRLYFWQVAVRMADAKPLTGVGFNGFRPSYATYDTSGAEFGEDRAVHSAWFGVLAEMGYPGLVLFVCVILVALHACHRVKRMARDNPAAADLESYAIGLQTSFIAYIVGMSFLNGQYNEMFWHLIGLTVALERIAADVVREAVPAGEMLATASHARPFGGVAAYASGASRTA
jgi:probable O-glycosylation ligase (exosortase A-associated)